MEELILCLGKNKKQELRFDVTETIKDIWRCEKRVKVKGPKL